MLQVRLQTRPRDVLKSLLPVIARRERLRRQEVVGGGACSPRYESYEFSPAIMPSEMRILHGYTYNKDTLLARLSEILPKIPAVPTVRFPCDVLRVCPPFGPVVTKKDACIGKDTITHADDYCDEGYEGPGESSVRAILLGACCRCWHDNV